MKITRFGTIAAVATLGALALTSCASNEGTAPTSTDGTGSTLAGELNGSGASSQESAQGAWQKAFQEANTGVTVNYDSTGSGTGRDQFIAGAVNFVASDRAFKTDEISGSTFAACAADSGLVEVPAYISPIAIVFNLEGVDTLNLDAATVAGIFDGQITSWDDEAIASQNPDVTLPSSAITPVHRSDDSGTTENFTDYLFQAAPDAWTYEPDGVWPIEGGEAADGTSGLISAVTEGAGTIGYADASRADGLGLVSIKVGDEYVPYSAEAAAATIDASELETGRTAGDLAFTVARTTEDPSAYPIVLVSYLIACESYDDANIGALAKAYIGYATSAEGQAAAAEAAGSAPLSPAISEQVAAAVELIQG